MPGCSTSHRPEEQMRLTLRGEDWMIVILKRLPSRSWLAIASDASTLKIGRLEPSELPPTHFP